MVNISNGMRIAITTGIYPPDLGGPAKHSQMMRDFLRSSGAHPIVVAYGDQKESGVWRVSRALPFGARHLIYFIKCLLVAFVSDVIYAQDAAGAGLPAMLAAKLLRRKLVLRIGGDLAWERWAENSRRPLSLKEFYEGGSYFKKAPLLFLITRFVLNQAQAIIVPAVMLKEVYQKFYGVAAEKIYHIANPGDIAAAGNRETRSDEIIFAGRFLAYKNLELLLKAFDKARARSGRGRLVLIGDGPERVELEILRKKLASRDQIEIKYPMERVELSKEISSTGICVAPALTEFNPNFILECVSRGKPVLLSAENGLSIRLPDDFLFHASDEKALTDKIANLLDPAEYKKAVEKIEKLPKAPAFADVAGEIFNILQKNS